jgi:hypothetical protein
VYNMKMLTLNLDIYISGMVVGRNRRVLVKGLFGPSSVLDCTFFSLRLRTNRRFLLGLIFFWFTRGIVVENERLNS